MAGEEGEGEGGKEGDDAAYTLCVLLGRTGVHDAVLAAEEHLASGA
ncbi:DUF5133 domain-containing protein [Streptomyces sp. OR43]|nr:DUF5133 domain-containing protein [Streptomyces sp. or43]TXS44410.1 DUF5133 domain-containing protein [Streptomyces sp. or43]